MRDLLRVSDLSVRYRDIPVFSHFSLDLRRGEIVGITGVSGAGKTTLARAILGTLPRYASVTGAIEFHGSHASPVFQEPSGALHPMLPCGQQVAEVIRARVGCRGSACRKRACEAMDSAGLAAAEHYSAYPHQLSGGQRQRVLIAQALASEPDLIVADEPTASLDAVSQDGIVKLLGQITRTSRAALIFITHRPALLHAMADRIISITGEPQC